MVHCKMKKMNKRGQGLVGGIIAGVIGLVILTIVSFLIVDTINGAGLLNQGTSLQNETYAGANELIKNMTEGVDEVSAKIPTILLIAAVVILFGAIALLVARSKGMTGGGSL